MAVALEAVLAELQRWVGWREGPNNDQSSGGDWGRRQGVGNGYAYCDSAACMCPYDVGYRWQGDSTYGERGEAYTVTHVNRGVRDGEFRYDHTSTGDPCDVEPGDLLFYDWNGTGQPDHVETAIERRVGDGRTHNIGFNTGSPNGCWDLWRDAKYLLGRLRPSQNGGYDRGGSTPTPPPSEEDDDMANYEQVLREIQMSLMDPEHGIIKRLEVGEYNDKATNEAMGRVEGAVRDEVGGLGKRVEDLDAKLDKIIGHLGV